jgi:hypothetical protein
MTDDDWDLLIQRIKGGACTPFIGAGASAPPLPRGTELAKEWAKAHRYPLKDKSDLAQVTQFIGVHRNDLIWPKDLINKKFAELGTPEPGDDEPHRVLAELDLPLYLTTNYDSFMADALTAQKRDVKRALCRWNDLTAVQNYPDPWADPDFQATPAQPVVFHLHGILDVVDSLVLTQDDYLDFLVAISADRELLPLQIVAALQETTLMFVGYGLGDWNFRVLHRSLVLARSASQRRLSVTVQFPGSNAAKAYLGRYFGRMNLEVFWGTAQEFTRELRSRWERAK